MSLMHKFIFGFLGFIRGLSITLIAFIMLNSAMGLPYLVRLDSIDKALSFTYFIRILWVILFLLLAIFSKYIINILHKKYYGKIHPSYTGSSFYNKKTLVIVIILIVFSVMLFQSSSEDIRLKEIYGETLEKYRGEDYKKNFLKKT